MTLSLDDLKELSQVASDAAQKAGRLIQSYVDKRVEVHSKQGGSSLASQVVTEVDQKSEALILECLEESISKYDLAVLTEEQEDDGQRLEKDYFWCIDPLDGTLAFTERKPGYAVSIALVSKTGIPLIGIVFDPVTSDCYSAIKGLGVTKNTQTWLLPEKVHKGTLTLPCDRSLVGNKHFDSFLSALTNWAKKSGYDGVEVLSGPGAVMNAISVLEKPHSCYFKPPKPEQGGGSLWDFAATACIFNELDAFVSDFEGDELALNREDSTFMNHAGVMYGVEEELISAVRVIAVNTLL